MSQEARRRLDRSCRKAAASLRVEELDHLWITGKIDWTQYRGRRTEIEELQSQEENRF